MEAVRKLCKILTCFKQDCENYLTSGVYVARCTIARILLQKVILDVIQPLVFFILPMIFKKHSLNTFAQSKGLVDIVQKRFLKNQ